LEVVIASLAASEASDKGLDLSQRRSHVQLNGWVADVRNDGRTIADIHCRWKPWTTGIENSNTAHGD
jgi:hypothetical protein